MDEISDPPHRANWGDRVAGVAFALTSAGIRVRATDLLIDSEVPFGGGMSSSAALSVALTFALGGPPDLMQVAHIARVAETEFVGVPCGIMDPFISTHGRVGHAALLDCSTLDYRYVRLSPEAVWVVVNSMVRHNLSNPGYADRVSECQAAAQALGLSSLREATLNQLNSLQPVLAKRVRHVVSETSRVEQFACAAEQSDRVAMGKLMNESHASLKNDYEVSSPELDFLVDTAQSIPGVFGSRMMGGGFGGSTISLMSADTFAEFRRKITARYLDFQNVAPEIYVCHASDGAGPVAVPARGHSLGSKQ